MRSDITGLLTASARGARSALHQLGPAAMDVKQMGQVGFTHAALGVRVAAATSPSDARIFSRPTQFYLASKRH
mgnify:CR=1 FL=1